MARLALGVVGAVIGNMIAPGIGGSIGFALGSMAGGFVDPGKLPKIEGPRVNDKRVTTSNYGVSIPETYGTVPVAGDYDWCTDLIEETITTTSGGKGPAPEQQVSESTYHVHCRVSSSVGPGRILKIKMNGLTVYENTTGEAVSDPRGNANCNVDYTIIGEIRLFDGDEDQLPDSIEESYLGVGNVPGYRGKVGCVVEHLVLTKLGNRPPTFEFEVAKIKADIPAGVESTLLYEELSANGADGVAYQNGRVFYPLGIARVLVIDATTGALLNTIVIAAASFNPIVSDPVSGYVWAWTNNRLYRILNTGTLDATLTGATQTGLVYNKNNGDLWRTISGGTMRKIIKSTGASTGTAITFWYDVTFDALGNTWQVDGGTKTLRKITTANVTTTYTVTTAATYLAWIEYDPDRNSVWLLCGGASTHELVEFSLVSLTVVQTLALPFGTVDLAFQWLRYDSANQRLWFASTTTDDVHVVDTATATMLATAAYDASTFAGPAAINEDGCAFFPGFTTGFATTTVRKFCYTAASIDFTHYWQDVVQAVSDKVGLGDYLDLPTRTDPDIVDGYRITAQMPARAAIEPLSPVYYFDGVESGEVVKYVKRGAASALTIGEDDLAAHDQGDAPPILEVTRGQELELPKEVSVTYLRGDGEYEQGMQYDRRQTVEADGVAAIEAPIVMSDDKALEVAQVNLYQSWLNRDRYTIAVSREYSKLEPTDIITAVKDDVSHVLRIIKVQESGGIRTLDAVREDSSIYTQEQNSAGSLIEDTYSPAPIEPTEILLLDIPMLRDEDDDAGFYAVATSAAESFGGAVLYRSVDGGTSYDRVETFTTRGIVGTTAGALGDFTGGNVFDTVNTVSVVLDRGELESTTELGALNGLNAAAIGADGRWEIVIFQTATLTAPLTYTLSTLLRGRLGTEWAIPLHQAGDRFVLLSVGLKRIPGSLATLGMERQYKAVSSGEVIGDVTAEDFTNTGVALKPYSPTQLEITNDGSNNLTGTFVRRTRAHWDSIDAREAPLFEESESYEIDVLDVGSPTVVVRTITATDEIFTYSAAQQTADGLTPGDEHTYRIYQISASVGRGYVLEVTA